MIFEFNRQEYREKVLGCWMGKNIGGTIGAPFEFKRQINNVNFYTQNLDGNPVANDDLDLQLLWLIALEEKGPKLDAHLLAQYWLAYITPHWSEYGTCKANLRLGLPPPLSGGVNNRFKHSNGAWIRSEIWACIAPANPELAALYALEDAMVDHGDGEGTWSAVFCAALESAAFVENDLQRLIEIGLSYLPESSAVRRAIADTLHWHHEGKTWKEARHEILRAHRGQRYPSDSGPLPPHEAAENFHDGVLGWDAPCNIALLIVALLYGNGDFSETMCLAVNCGEDTDCTAATAGAIFGILRGHSKIPEKWIKPIGRTIKVGCLNFGELGCYGDQLPATIDDLTERTIRLQARVKSEMTYQHPIAMVDGESKAIDFDFNKFKAGAWFVQVLSEKIKGPVYYSTFFEATVDYGEEGPYIEPGKPKAVKVVLRNTYKQQMPAHCQCLAAGGLEALPPISGACLAVHPFHGDQPAMAFHFQGDGQHSVYRAVVEYTFPGYAEIFHVPIILLQALGR